ncbi:MAG: hypothetical protein EBS42_04350 [Caulobacteraceae bacterium]|nr:hypothetical protein [Caulobacteraceae bacterium]
MTPTAKASKANAAMQDSPACSQPANLEMSLINMVSVPETAGSAICWLPVNRRSVTGEFLRDLGA